MYCLKKLNDKQGYAIRLVTYQLVSLNTTQEANLVSSSSFSIKICKQVNKKNYSQCRLKLKPPRVYHCDFEQYNQLHVFSLSSYGMYILIEFLVIYWVMLECTTTSTLKIRNFQLE